MKTFQSNDFSEIDGFVCIK